MSLSRKLGRLSMPAPLALQPTPETFEDRTRPREVFRRTFGAGHRHGHAPLSRALEVDPWNIAALALDPTLGLVSYRRMLLLDTETTGLSGGTGTLPFLIGMGTFNETGELGLQQLFLRRPGLERPMLTTLADALVSASCVVTYNGKAFDWPLLRARFVMNRMTPPQLPPHLDLLHCARRAFRHRGEGAKLTAIERELLGHHRVGDVPGFAIPALYFDYLHCGAFEPLMGVLDHNAQDLVLLAALLGELSERFAGPRPRDDARDLLGLAEVSLRVRDWSRAEAFSLASLESHRGPRLASLRTRAWGVAGRARLKSGRPVEACAAFEAALETASQTEGHSLRLALAKLLEHALRDAGRALGHARHAWAAEPAERHQRRISRLGKKTEGGAPVSH